MSTTAIKLTNIQRTPRGITAEVVVLDRTTGETIRPARISDELIQLLQSMEIDAEYYLDIMRMKQNYTNFGLLIRSFNLITE